MRPSKVARVLGFDEVPEGEAIQIALYASNHPTYPWAAAAEGTACMAATPHRALERLLETLAKSRRAERQS